LRIEWRADAECGEGKRAEPDKGQPRNSKNDEFVQEVAETNVRLILRQIRERRPVLREMLETGKIGLVGGMYDLKTGEVHFFAN
jgi:carbonic anhydrase